MVEIREVDVEDLFGVADKLLAEHWDEVALNKHIMVLDPDIDAYLAMRDSGFLLCVAAYDKGELVGYSINILKHHPHYKQLTVVQNDLLFVTKAYRKSGVGVRLIRETESKAKKLGVQMVLWHAKQHSTLDQLLLSKGYQVQDIIYSKEL